MNNSLSTEVYNNLLDRLLKNELIPGEIINRRQIAEELGVSVSPVLEAMLQLEVEGFLESMPRKGTRVRLIKQEDIVGQLILREAIECQASRMYCGEPVLANMESLLQLAQEVDAAGEEYLEDWKIEIVFHKQLVALTNCHALNKEFDRIINLNVFFGMNKLIPPYKKTKRDNHIHLVNALTTPDPDKAENLMRKHLMVGKDYLLNAQI